MKPASIRLEPPPRSVNPATEELLEEFAFQNEREIEDLLDRAAKAQRLWKAVSLQDRAAVLQQVAKTLRSSKSRLARDITLEMGKPISEAEAEVEKCAWNCDYVAVNAADWLKDESVATNASESYVSFLPLGTILAIMPWNFPLWQVFRFGASALIAGNGILLKHAPNVMRCATNIERVLVEAGVPKDLFRNLIIPVELVGRILSDKRVAAATVTGSPRAGAAVASQAGAELKKCILELGGSDAFVVLPDADIEAAVAAGIRGRFANCGQVCLAPKRFILVGSIVDEFESRFASAVKQLRVDDPLSAETQLGPLARKDLRDGLDQQVQNSIRAGARALVGGGPKSGRGFFYEPTVLTNLTPEMPVSRNETFGPVAALFRTSKVEEALQLANASDYGLSANIWTRDVENARQYARSVEAGSVFINGVAASDPRLPIGGVKRSGFGRELASFGIREFVNIQTVWIGPDK